MKTANTVPFAILLGGVIVAAAVYFTIARPAPNTYSGTGNPALVRPVDSRDHILGNPSAKVMIIEYADFDCEFCKNFDDIMHQVIANEGASGKVAWVYRQFPIPEIKGHENTFTSSEAAECVAKVGGNDAFWKFADALYANQPASPTTYGTLATNVGVPGDAFTNCYTNAATLVDARIKADRQNALDMGAIGTPFSVVISPGKVPAVMPSAWSYDAVKMIIDQALAQ